MNGSHFAPNLILRGDSCLLRLLIPREKKGRIKKKMEGSKRKGTNPKGKEKQQLEKHRQGGGHRAHMETPGNCVWVSLLERKECKNPEIQGNKNHLSGKELKKKAILLQLIQP